MEHVPGSVGGRSFKCNCSHNFNNCRYSVLASLNRFQHTIWMVGWSSPGGKMVTRIRYCVCRFSGCRRLSIISNRKSLSGEIALKLSIDLSITTKCTIWFDFRLKCVVGHSQKTYYHQLKLIKYFEIWLQFEFFLFAYFEVFELIRYLKPAPSHKYIWPCVFTKFDRKPYCYILCIFIKIKNALSSDCYGELPYESKDQIKVLHKKSVLNDVPES